MADKTIQKEMPAVSKGIHSRSEVPACFREDYDRYENWLKNEQKSDNTIYTRQGRIKVFLIYLSDNSCDSLNRMNNGIILDFMIYLNERYSSYGKTNILYTLRDFFKCPEIARQLNCDPWFYLSNLYTKRHERLPSAYCNEEIKKVLASVDRSTSMGKSDYAMMILACVYGLRAIDIRELLLTSVDWKEEKITLFQHKTGKYLSLPLIEPVAMALLDYLKNARPESEDPHVFIRQRKPHRPYGKRSHLSYRVAIYFKLANIVTDDKHHGFHCLRHSLATNLSENNVPVSTIADILGHTTVQSTKAYIWSDIKHLCCAALEVPEYGQ